MEFAVGLLLAAVFCGGVGCLFGRTVGKAATGWWLGCIFGPLGWVLVLLLPRRQAARSSPVRSYHARPEALDPVEAWETQERLKPENLKPLVKKRTGEAAAE